MNTMNRLVREVFGESKEDLPDDAKSCKWYDDEDVDGNDVYVENYISSERSFLQKLQSGDYKISSFNSNLGNRNLEIFKRRFGLGGYEVQTYVAIGKHFSISHNRVRDIIQKILRIVRHPSRHDLFFDGYVYDKNALCFPKEKFDYLKFVTAELAGESK